MLSHDPFPFLVTSLRLLFQALCFVYITVANLTYHLNHDLDASILMIRAVSVAGTAVNGVFKPMLGTRKCDLEGSSGLPTTDYLHP